MREQERGQRQIYSILQLEMQAIMFYFCSRENLAENHLENIPCQS